MLESKQVPKRLVPNQQLERLQEQQRQEQVSKQQELVQLELVLVPKRQEQQERMQRRLAFCKQPKQLPAGRRSTMFFS